jgi:hypothetical protein
MIETISINYDLCPKSSLDICFNEVITNLRLPMLTNSYRKTVIKTPENTLLHIKLKIRSVDKPTFTGVLT